MYCVVIIMYSKNIHSALETRMLQIFYRQGIKKGDTKKVIALCMFIQTLFFVSRLARNS